MRELVRFRLAFGCEPRTWREFQYCMAYLPIEESAFALRMADAIRAARSTDPGWEKARRELAIDAGLS